MKAIVFGLMLVMLTSCFGDSDEVKKAKQEMGVIPDEVLETQNIGDEREADEQEEEAIEAVEDTGGERRISIEYPQGEKALDLGELDYQDFKSGYVKIEGTTLLNVSKIQVNFSNKESDFPNDSFVLKKFTAGDRTFEYNASSKFKVLDFGINEYEFIAHHAGGTSTLVLNVLVSENDDEYLDGESYDPEVSGNTEEVANSDISTEAFPEGEKFGTVRELGNGEFTYSGIKGLSINKEKLGAVNCEADEETGEYFISTFLKEKMTSWYYWNTCRDVVKKTTIGLYVVRLDGEEYIYEKHYIDTKNGLYGVVELERGTGVDKESISDKNKELKERNADFAQTVVVDDLFKELAK